MADAGARRGPSGRCDLTRVPIGPTLLKFALPTLASSILQSLNGTINSIWVGRFLGEGALHQIDRIDGRPELYAKLIDGLLRRRQLRPVSTAK